MRGISPKRALANEIRLSVEQVSYAHTANPAQAPLFTLEAHKFSGPPGEIVAHPRAERQRQIHPAELISGALTPLSGRFCSTASSRTRSTPRTRRSASPLSTGKPAALPARAWEFVLRAAMPMALVALCIRKTMFLNR